MKRYLVYVAALALLAPPLSAFGVQIKIATLSPEGSFWMQQMRQAADEIESGTGGRVRIKYYPGGVMGNDQAVLQKIRIGQLHGAAIMAGSLSDVFPYIQIYGLPMKFRSFEEVDYIRGRMDSLLIEGLEKGGFVAFGPAEGGFAYIMSKYPVQTISQLQQRKMWIPNEDPIAIEGVRTFDLTPIPLSIADVRSGLQTDLIDTVATSPIGAIALQWHTQIKYATDLPFMYIYAMFVIDQRAFSRIPEADAPLVRDTLSRMFHEIDRRNRKDNEEAAAVLREQRITFLTPEAAELENWRKRAAEVEQRLVENGSFSAEIIQTLTQHLSEFRKNGAP